MASTNRRPSLREEQKRFTRARLVEAALEVFERTGYAAATIEEITNAAGASRATFYLHFKSKADIVQELQTGALREESDGIYESLWALPDPSWDEVREFVASTLTFWDRHRVPIEVINQAVHIDHERVGKTMATMITHTARILGDYLHDVRGVEAETAYLRAILLIAQLDRFHFFWNLPSVELDREHVLDTIADIWWSAFQPDGSKRRR